MSKMEQEIFKSIQTIAKRLIDKAGYDKTITGVVIHTPTAEEVFYIVQNENAQYHAKYSGQEKIQIGDSVYMLIPNNDTSKTKFILGKV